MAITLMRQHCLTRGYIFGSGYQISRINLSFDSLEKSLLQEPIDVSKLSEEDRKFYDKFGRLPKAKPAAMAVRQSK